MQAMSQKYLIPLRNYNRRGSNLACDFHAANHGRERGWGGFHGLLVVNLEGELKEMPVIGPLTRRFMQGPFELPAAAAAAVVFADVCDRGQKSKEVAFADPTFCWSIFSASLMLMVTNEK